jgi:hypothetical protein
LGKHKEDCTRLENKRLYILKIEEETWRQKSRATWLSKGDLNTKYFHNYANERRITNSIWELVDAGGRTIRDQASLKKDALFHFQGIFVDTGTIPILEQLKVINLFPTLFFLKMRVDKWPSW